MGAGNSRHKFAWGGVSLRSGCGRLRHPRSRHFPCRTLAAAGLLLLAFAGARAQEEIPAPGTSGGDAAAPSTEAAEAEITQRRQQLAKLESLELRFRNQQRDLKDELANIQSNPQLLWEDLKEGISVMLSHPDVNLEAPDKPGYVMKTIPSSFVASDKTSVEEVTRLRRQFNDLVGLILDRMKSQLRDDRVRAEPEKTAVEQEIDALLVELEQKADAPNE